VERNPCPAFYAVIPDKCSASCTQIWNPDISASFASSQILFAIIFGKVAPNTRNISGFRIDLRLSPHLSEMTVKALCPTAKALPQAKINPALAKASFVVLHSEGVF
jgi:hypothetical protein